MAKDFTAWARPDLVLTLGGREYRSRPPTFGQVDLLLAITVRLELEIGIVKGEMPADLAELITQHATEPVALLTLGQETYDLMRENREDVEAVRRMGLYAALYWARGEEHADEIAELLWSREKREAEEAAAPKDRKGSTSGPSTASASPTSTGSTPTTASPRTSSRQRRKKGPEPTPTS
jgi:hypothetical protein